MSILTSLDEWTSVCNVEDIPRLGSRVVRHADQDSIAIFRASDDHIFAVSDRCPHKGGPLSAGLVHGHAVTCPLHSWTIDLATGQAQAPDNGCARKVPVKVEEGCIYLALKAQD